MLQEQMKVNQIPKTCWLQLKSADKIQVPNELNKTDMLENATSYCLKVSLACVMPELTQMEEDAMTLD
jgi:hypothetical protein